MISRSGDDLRWWTWAGFRANATLRATLGGVADEKQSAGDVSIGLRLDMVTANSCTYRKNFTPLEEATALFAAYEAGASRTRIGKATGRKADQVPPVGRNSVLPGITLRAWRVSSTAFRLGELPIDEVVWSEERAKHIRTRAGRKGPAEVDIEPLWASEAALDPNRLVRRGTGRESVEVLGYSPSARRVLLVWIYTTERPPGGWQGGSAIAAGRRLRAAYWEGRGDDREN